MISTPSTEDTASRRVQYLRVFVLGFSAFIFNTTEFVPVGLLSDIAQSFSIPPAQVGWMLTVYAWIVALMSLPMMLLTRKLERKTLLIGLFALFIASHILTVVAWSFTTLLVSRIGIAFSHAVFWSITASIAIRVAPQGKHTFALSVLATGTGLAMVLGVPAGRIIGQLLGWRTTFAVIAIIALIIMLAMYRLLPNLPSLFSGSLSKVPEVLRNKVLLGMYLFIFVIFSAHYTAYSYIEPFLKEIGSASGQFTTLVLLLFGLAGIVGSILFSYFGERANTLMLVSSVVIASFSMSVLYFVAPSGSLLIACVLLWGASLMIIGLSMQIRVLKVDDTAADIIMSLYSGIINLGIGAGALIGSQVIQLIGLASVGFTGAILGICALVVIWSLLKRIKIAVE
ncbi:sugar transporter [Marinomonas rhizomae]|uniref:DHA1 family L-arabinose/isopropyl-beta-D-thiogalactopyranoside export protein-like MFS transporter n=1 Tax=Marinomonas rhizomae TaxID=491948 RepID=A0A366J007_9GAMM|nr:sugar transporter [Marinomonas rhizomae]RBP79574.1 DHA1 family L-arabinose/isopropyl-beta-D-thiogalactopyranoside export protein-like MFS transporter [Marinomonas rhizomae]RNF71575.1 sugar transporter [Marinomonas rhizomae]